METAERIVEAYVRYVKKWATIPNIKCKGQNEIDLLAVGKKKKDRYHIEISGTIDLAWRTLSAADLRDMIQKKFAPESVTAKLLEYGFHDDNYKKVLVHWDWNDEAKATAHEHGVILWSLQKILKKIGDRVEGETLAFPDDTLRTFQLLKCAGMLVSQE